MASFTLLVHHMLGNWCQMVREAISGFLSFYQACFLCLTCEKEGSSAYDTPLNTAFSIDLSLLHISKSCDFHFFSSLVWIIMTISFFAYSLMGYTQSQKKMRTEKGNNYTIPFEHPLAPELLFLLQLALSPTCQLHDLACPPSCPPTLISLHFVAGSCCPESQELITS